MSEELSVTRESTRPVAILAARSTNVAHARAPSEDVAGLLRRLIGLCEESAHGLRNAARASSLPCFRSMLSTSARHRAEIARELQTALLDIEEDAEDHSGPIATGARGVWSEVMTATDDLARLTICERAEETTKRSFEETRRRGLPAHLDAIVARQSQLVADSIEHLRSIRQH
jgi:uncharacterized protein (TIGR02284 family)